MPTALVPATTTNLGPGFDALGLALQLYNRVSIHRAETPSVEVRGEGSHSLPRDSRNLALRAAVQCFSAAGEEPGPLRVALENSIPVGRGLGSSAAAIVGGLLAANSLVGSPLPPSYLLNMAWQMEGHPDNVAPALLGGFRAACVDGQEVLQIRLPTPPDLRAVVAIPEKEQSTEKSRSLLPAYIPRRDAVFNIGRLALLLGALTTGRTDLLAAAMEDRLHQPYRGELLPGFEAVLAAARAAGAVGACLSGAGSTVLAFVEGDGSAVGEAMCGVFAEHGLRARHLALDFDEAGARLTDEDADTDRDD